MQPLYISQCLFVCLISWDSLLWIKSLVLYYCVVNFYFSPKEYPCPRDWRSSQYWRLIDRQIIIKNWIFSRIFVNVYHIGWEYTSAHISHCLIIRTKYFYKSTLNKVETRLKCNNIKWVMDCKSYRFQKSYKTRSYICWPISFVDFINSCCTYKRNLVDFSSSCVYFYEFSHVFSPISSPCGGL